MDFAAEYENLRNSSTVAVGKIIGIDNGNDNDNDNVGIGLPIAITGEQCANIKDVKIDDVICVMWYSNSSVFGSKLVTAKVTHIERPELCYIKLRCNGTMTVQQALIENGAEIVDNKRLNVSLIVVGNLVRESCVGFVIQQGQKRFTVSVANECESPQRTSFILAIKPCQ